MLVFMKFIFYTFVRATAATDWQYAAGTAFRVIEAVSVIHESVENLFIRHGGISYVSYFH